MSDQSKSASNQDTYSVKTTSGVKDELNELLRLTGLPSKELFEAMVTNYKLTALQGTEAETIEDVQQVRYHLSRAENLFINLIQKNQDVKQDYTSRIDQENALHKQITDELQQQKTLAIQERDKARGEQTEIIEDMKKSNEFMVELTDRARSDRLTIDVLTHKTEELESKVATMPRFEEQVAQLNQDKISCQHQVDKLQAELSKYKELLDSSQVRISDIYQEREKEAQQAQESAKKDIEQLKYIHQLEIEKAVLEAVSKTRDEYYSKIDSMTQKIDIIATRNQELVDRIHTFELQK